MSKVVKFRNNEFLLLVVKSKNVNCRLYEITNEIRNAITKRDKLFHQWVQSPNEINRDLYKRQRNIVTSLIRNAKRDCNYKKLGNNPSSKTIYRTLKYQLAKDEPKNNIPDIKKLNEYFTSIGEILSKKSQNTIAQ